MIRINLLDSSKKKTTKAKVPTGAPMFLLYILLLVLEGLLLYYWSEVKTEALTTQKRLTTEAKAKVEAIAGKKKEMEAKKAKVDAEKAKTGVFDKLHLGRVAMYNVLSYMSFILTPDEITSDFEQEPLNWDVRWDTDRAWFTNVTENKDGDLLISGQAISQQDVIEVYNRLNACIYLQDLNIVKSVRKIRDNRKGNSEELYDFTLMAALNHNPEIGKKGPAEPVAQAAPPAPNGRK